MPPRRGVVYLIGAGPGAPDLLTLRAARALGRVDLLLYDRLVAPEIVAMASSSVERVYVGKAPGHHAMSQEAIQQTMIDAARRGERVGRLKGGDPGVFGRGGEEVEALVRAGVDVEIIPGVTAAAGCAASSGIALTDRRLARCCVLVAGHDDELDWQALARPRQTVVFYMGLARLDAICRRLIEHGADPATPAAVVENGTTTRQRSCVAQLRELAARARLAAMRSPSLIIVGDVVGAQHASAFARVRASSGPRPIRPRLRQPIRTRGAAVEL